MLEILKGYAARFNVGASAKLPFFEGQTGNLVTVTLSTGCSGKSLKMLVSPLGEWRRAKAP
jgi:hypothetical protein